MNAESEMAGADGLGAERLDPCAQIAESVGYSDGADGDDEGGVDALIDYKNALEDALRRALDENRTTDSEAARAAEQIAAGVPKLDDWRSAADFMEHAAKTLDIYSVPRPDRYEED